MFNGWLKIEYSSDEDNIPTWKQWALMGNYLKYNNKNTYRIFLNNVTTIDIITEENKKKVMGTLVGGTAGLLLLGPLGAIGGILLGGNKNMVNIAVGLNDGRHFVASCTTKTHLSLLKFKGKGGAPNPVSEEMVSSTPSSTDDFLSLLDSAEVKLVKTNDTKECPMCAETVKAKAKICRFCKHKFELETEEIAPPAKTKETLYDVHFKGLLKDYYEDEAAKILKSIFGCNLKKARSYINWNQDNSSGIIKGRTLDEAKKLQSKFKLLGVKINYCKNNGNNLS
jgi:hypothetical protein